MSINAEKLRVARRQWYHLTDDNGMAEQETSVMTSLVCDFAEMLVTPTGNYRMQVTKVCALQEIALDYGFLVMGDMEHDRPTIEVNKKTLDWMRHEIKQQIWLCCQQDDMILGAVWPVVTRKLIL